MSVVKTNNISVLKRKDSKIFTIPCALPPTATLNQKSEEAKLEYNGREYNKVVLCNIVISGHMVTRDRARMIYELIKEQNEDIGLVRASFHESCETHDNEWEYVLSFGYPDNL